MRDPRIRSAFGGGKLEKFLTLVAPVLKTADHICCYDFIRPQPQLTAVLGNNIVLMLPFRGRSKGTLLDASEFHFALCVGSLQPGSGDFISSSFKEVHTWAR